MRSGPNKRELYVVGLVVVFGVVVVAFLVASTRRGNEQPIPGSEAAVSSIASEPELRQSELDRYDSSTLDVLRLAIPAAIRSLADEPTAVSGDLLGSETAELLASAAASELSDVGPVYDGAGTLIGHSFVIPVPRGAVIFMTKPRPYTEQFQALDPLLAKGRPIRLDGVASMTIIADADATIHSIEHHPVGVDGQQVTLTDLTPADQRPELVTDADGNPTLTEDGNMLLRVGDRTIEVAPGNAEG